MGAGLGALPNPPKGVATLKVTERQCVKSSCHVLMRGTAGTFGVMQLITAKQDLDVR